MSIVLEPKAAFGNHVGNSVEAISRDKVLVSKVEKSEELFALEMERCHGAVSTRITKLAHCDADSGKYEARNKAKTNHHTRQSEDTN